MGGYGILNGMALHREQTQRLFVGKVPVGGGAPISIQSMTNTLTSDIRATVVQVKALEDAGCDIVRISIPDEESLVAFPHIKREASIPVVADIHFDHRLAAGAMEAGADGIRINPGNIGRKEKVAEIARIAIERSIPIRVGVNMGSVKRRLLVKYGKDRVGALVESANRQVQMLEEMGVRAIKVSLKSSDVRETIDAYRRFAQISNWPLHLGVTEAGTIFSGAIRSAAGLGILLQEGIGDTIRMSLSGDPVKEIMASKILLECLGLREEGIRVVACPTCARANADVAAISSAVEEAVAGIRNHMVVAIMGCVVNGPGEARDADLGVACDAKGALLFVKGKPLKRIQYSEILPTILTEIKKESKR
jgi:(E)-4-hydroxy-3-methylbut-2-enyl-diphosphate synthase